MSNITENIQFFSYGQTCALHYMAEIEKEEVCNLVTKGVAQGGNTFFLSFIHIVQLYKEDCTILQIF